MLTIDEFVALFRLSAAICCLWIVADLVACSGWRWRKTGGVIEVDLVDRAWESLFLAVLIEFMRMHGGCTCIGMEKMEKGEA